MPSKKDWLLETLLCMRSGKKLLCKTRPQTELIAGNDKHSLVTLIWHTTDENQSDAVEAIALLQGVASGTNPTACGTTCASHINSQRQATK